MSKTYPYYQQEISGGFDYFSSSLTTVFKVRSTSGSLDFLNYKLDAWRAGSNAPLSAIFAGCGTQSAGAYAMGGAIHLFNNGLWSYGFEVLSGNDHYSMCGNQAAMLLLPEDTQNRTIYFNLSLGDAAESTQNIPVVTTSRYGVPPNFFNDSSVTQVEPTATRMGGSLCGSAGAALLSGLSYRVFITYDGRAGFTDVLENLTFKGGQGVPWSVTAEAPFLPYYTLEDGLSAPLTLPSQRASCLTGRQDAALLGVSGYNVMGFYKYSAGTWSVAPTLLVNSANAPVRAVSPGPGAVLSGTQNACVLVGGGQVGLSSTTGLTATFNGSVWSAAGSMLQPRFGHAQAGSRGAAMATGGVHPTTSVPFVSSELFYGNINVTPSEPALASVGPSGERASDFSSQGRSRVVVSAGEQGSLRFGIGEMSSISYQDQEEIASLTEVGILGGHIPTYFASVSAGPSLNTARAEFACFGSFRSAFVAGGYNGARLNSTEKQGASAFSVSASLPAATDKLGGVGTQGAAMVFGGRTDFQMPVAPNTRANATFYYDGALWSVHQFMLSFYAAANTQGAGFVNSALAVRGSEFSSERYSSNAWSVAGRPALTNIFSATGVQNDALAIGSNVGNSLLVRFNGNAWSAFPNTSANRQVVSGRVSSPTAMGSTVNGVEFYNGSAWVVVGSLSVSRTLHSATGAGSSLVVGGFKDTTPTAYLSSTEKVVALEPGLVVSSSYPVTGSVLT